MPAYLSNFSIYLPDGPCPSALPSPPLSFEPGQSVEQINRPARLKELGVSSELLSYLRRKFNQVEFPVMNNARFEELVLESVRDRHAKNLYQPEDIEAEIERRTNEDNSKLDEDFTTSRYKALPEILKALPNDKQLKFYLTRLLAADNIYDIKSFVAYAIAPILECLTSKAIEGTDDIQVSRNETCVGQTRSRATQISSFQSVNRSKSSSSTDPTSLESTSTNTRRRSPRLVGRPSQHYGIRKAVKKSRQLLSTNKHRKSNGTVPLDTSAR